MPSACATCTGPGALTVAMPSMSRMVRPASATALTAASRCSWRVEWSGSLPTASVSAAPAMITPRSRLMMLLLLRAVEDRDADVAALLERHLQFHVQDEVLRGVRDAGDVGHHPWPLGELDHGDRVRRLGLEAARRPVVDHVGVQRGAAAGGEPLDVGRAALRADRPWVEVRLAAVAAALDHQFAAGAAVPERLRLWRRLGEGLGGAAGSSWPGSGGRLRHAQTSLPGAGWNERSTCSARSSSCHGSWPMSRPPGDMLL